MPNLIKYVLAVMLLSCLINMPYGYYQFVRFIATLGFAYLANESHNSDQQGHTIALVILALLFQPFFKIALGRVLWNIVDVGVAFYLLVFLRLKKKSNIPPSS